MGRPNSTACRLAQDLEIAQLVHQPQRKSFALNMPVRVYNVEFGSERKSALCSCAELPAPSQMPREPARILASFETARPRHGFRDWIELDPIDVVVMRSKQKETWASGSHLDTVEDKRGCMWS
jgi:hypothetical protein